jgi:septation ring formation regulator EzrA
MATAKSSTLKEVGETLAFIVERMATKEDLKQFATKDDVREIVRAIIQEEVPGIVAIELKPVRNDLKQIEERLDTLEQHYANLKGVTKEIDEIRGEVRAIEKHLGIERKIAA